MDNRQNLDSFGVETILGFGVVIKNGLGLCRDRAHAFNGAVLILQGGLKSSGSDFVLKMSELVFVRFYSGIIIIYVVIP